MLSIEIITLTLVTIINAMVVWIISSQGWHIVVNRYFIASAGCVIFWSLGTLLVGGGSSPEVVNIGRAFFAIAPMYVILFLSLFAAIYPNDNGRALTPANKFLLAITVVFSGFIAISPESLIPTVTMSSTFNLYGIDPFWYTLYTLYFNVAFIIAFGEIIAHIRRTKGAVRQRLMYVFTGTFLVAAISLVTNLILPLLGNSSLAWIGPTSSLCYVVTVAISIVKHQLFDIKLAAVRSVAYIFVLLTMSLFYYVFAYVISIVVIGNHAADGVSVSMVNIALAIILAFLFQPIKSFFDQVTDNIFYRENYKSEVFFADLSDLLSSTVDLRGLLERASAQIANTFKAEQAFFFLYYTNVENHHMSAGTRDHSRLPMHDARMLDEHTMSSGTGIFLTDFLDNENVRRMLKSHKITLVMPLRHADQIAGYVMLGEHRSGNYTKRDLRVLSAVSNELVIAIQNALSLHEVRELNATLQQRIDVATKELRSSNAQLKHLDEVKDEFMSMASHQLRTPLTSIKGYLSMVLEGDVGKITPQQEKLLLEAFNSSERMVRLISDFLNVSRLQTGRFLIEKKPFELGEVVRQEVGDLQMIASSHALKLRLTVSSKQPLCVNGDADKIRQVMMNFIDNAIYYSREKGTIIINLERVKNEVAFTVVDTGIGVPEEEQSKLFTKFFRAKNARKQRPDGTGVGLFLARKVISAHGGTILFSSKEGRGSTFGFTLPLQDIKRSAVPVAPKPAIKAITK